MRTAALAAGLISLALLHAGCTREETGVREGADAPPAQSTREGADQVVARVDGLAIRADELDGPLRLAFHDLERARHELRARRLRQLISTRLGKAGETEAARVEILLAPPEPPRLDVDASGAPIRGAPAASVTIVEFLDFESSHCRRMQPILARILENYAGEVRLAVRDLPLEFHRAARRAALAAECARDQQAYWAYHDVLLHEQANLSAPDLERHARRLSLDPARFAACLEREQFAEDVEADLRIARLLGVSTAPTFFVNGAYFKGPQSYADLAAFIDRELGREPGAAERSRAGRASEERGGALSATAPGDAPPSVAPEILPPPDAVFVLRRADVDQAIRRRARLEQQFRFAPGTHDGRRLLQVERVEPGDLLDQLALHPDDVLLLVDGEWVTDARNPLWRALAERREVTLVILRSARRQVFRYAIE